MSESYLKILNDLPKRKAWQIQSCTFIIQIFKPRRKQCEPPTFQSYIYNSISLYCQYSSNLKTLVILMEKKTLMQSVRWSQKNMVAPKFQNPNFSYFHFQMTNNQNIIIIPNTNMGHTWPSFICLFIFLTSFNFGVLF